MTRVPSFRLTRRRLPQFAAHALSEAGLNKTVILTQPRIIAAREVASRLSVEMDCGCFYSRAVHVLMTSSSETGQSCHAADVHG
jgi:hypothetical protein